MRDFVYKLQSKKPNTLHMRLQYSKPYNYQNIHTNSIQAPKINERCSKISPQQITNPLTMWKTRQTACQQWGNNYPGLVPVPARPGRSRGTFRRVPWSPYTIDVSLVVKNVHSLELKIEIIFSVLHMSLWFPLIFVLFENVYFLLGNVTSMFFSSLLHQQWF